MRSEGGSRMGEEETTVVASERRIMLSGRTDSGARLEATSWGGRGGKVPGISATVEVRRSDEWMLRREWCFLVTFAMAKRHEGDVGDANDEVLRSEMEEEVEEREAVRWPGRRTARRPGTESMIGRPTENKEGGGIGCAVIRCAVSAAACSKTDLGVRAADSKWLTPWV